MKKITTLLFTLALLVTSKALFAQDALPDPGYRINSFRAVSVNIDSSNLLTEKIEVSLHTDEILTISFSAENFANSASKYLADFDLELNSNLQFLNYGGYDQNNVDASSSHHQGTANIESPIYCWSSDNNYSYYAFNKSFLFQAKGTGIQELTFTRQPFDHWDINGPQSIIGETLPPLIITVTIVP